MNNEKKQQHPFYGLGIGLSFALIMIAFGLMIWLASLADSVNCDCDTTPTEQTLIETSVEGTQMTVEEEWRDDVIEEVNRFRNRYQHDALEMNKDLNESAQAKAEALEEVGVFGHTLPDGTPFTAFFEDAEHYRARLGENLACGFAHPEATVLAWFYSKTHKRVMMSDDFDAVGVGVAPFIYKEGPREGKKCGLTVVLHLSGGKTYSYKATFYVPTYNDDVK